MRLICLPSLFLFFKQSLRPALLNVRELCYRISDMGLCKVEKGHTYALEEFKNTQMTQLSEVHERLIEFRGLVKEVVRSACRTALLEAGFTPDDYFIENADEQGGAILMLEISDAWTPNFISYHTTFSTG